MQILLSQFDILKNYYQLRRINLLEKLSNVYSIHLNKIYRMSLSSKKRIVRDPIHGFIDISEYPVIDKIIKNPFFQRLRRLSQLGVSVFVYPSATHNRFNHSLGAMKLFLKIFDLLYKNKKSYEYLRKLGLITVLLHDIGHGPFSHTSEKIFNFHHVNLSIKIIENEFSDILTNEDIDIKYLIQILNDQNINKKEKIISQLIDSNLDVDRLDYIARDSYFTGVGYGIDLERIIRTLTIYDGKGDLNGYMAVEEKGKHAIESYLLTRELMYRDIYYHKTTRCIENMINKIFIRLKECPNLLPNEFNFIGDNSQLTVNALRNLDDHTIYFFLNKFTKIEDNIISDFSNRILNRQLLKSYDYSHVEIDIEDLNDKIEKIKKYIDRLGKNSQYYYFNDQPKDRPYEPITNPKGEEEFRAMFRKNIHVISQNDKKFFL